MRLFPVLLLLLSAGRVWAVDVPFSTGHTIDGAFGGAISVVTADVDGDGDLDVLGAAQAAGDITWWENLNGAGTSWAAHTIDDAFLGAVSVHAADVDGDGDLDVLGAASDADAITWWENLTGAGTSWTAHSIAFPFDGAVSVHTVDVDGDGDLDVLGAAHVGDDITWWENLNGTGVSWMAHTIDGDFSGARAVYAADLDSDGDLDVLGAAANANVITWWENLNGAGTSWTTHTIDGDFDGAISVHAADMDGDGDLDVLGAALWGDDITWWENLNRAGTSWVAHTIDDDIDGAASVFAADVDGDGDLDVLGAARSAGDITWWENLNGAGTSWAAHTIEGDFDLAHSVHAADLDGDGDIDVLGAALAAGDITWWENKTIHRSPVFSAAHVVDLDFPSSPAPYPADVDGDGDLDVVVAAFAFNAMRWWENPKVKGVLWASHTINDEFNRPISSFAADIDRDGDLDVLGAARMGDEIAWWENLNRSGTSWTKHSIDDAFDGADSVRGADLDGDGDIDVLGATFEGDTIAWWENLGGSGTSWTKRTIDAAFDGVCTIRAADLDGDGDLDVLGAATGADDIAWWENLDGAGTSWTKHTIDATFDGAISVHAADVDGDGDLDVLGAAGVADDITWWENVDGAGTSWTEHTIDDAFDGANSVHAADLDGDGDLDVLGARSGEIAWWENLNGTGDNWSKHIFVGGFTPLGAYNSALFVDTADFDRDGDLDVLGASNGPEPVTWWENSGGQFALPTVSLAPSELTVPVEAAVLQIDAVHRGRAGDTDIELVSLGLFFNDGATALTEVQLNEAIEALRVYRDDGSGVLEPSEDALVFTLSSPSFTNGAQQISFADGNPDAQVSFGAPPRYFVVLDLVSAGLVNKLRVIHLIPSAGSAEDRDHDIPLTQEYAENTGTPVITLVAGPGADCPPNLVRANQTLLGTQTLKATLTATLGSNLIVNGADIAVHAPEVSILPDTSISGTFSVGNSPACP